MLRKFFRLFSTGIAFSLLFTSCIPEKATQKPNIIYILADDLGYGDLSCYGQKKFDTPHIDQLAAEGMLFTQHYAGSTVCAPSRCALMTGLHTGHAQIRGNREVMPEGQASMNSITRMLTSMATMINAPKKVILENSLSNNRMLQFILPQLVVVFVFDSGRGRTRYRCVLPAVQVRSDSMKTLFDDRLALIFDHLDQSFGFGDCSA